MNEKNWDSQIIVQIYKVRISTGIQIPHLRPGPQTPGTLKLKITTLKSWKVKRAPAISLN